MGHIKDKLGEWDWCRSTNRALDVTMARFRLGKVGLNKFLKDMDHINSNLCTQCNSGNVENFEHHLLFCMAYSDERQILRNNLRRAGVHVFDIPTLLGAAPYSVQIKRKITDLLASFIYACKRFEQ